MVIDVIGQMKVNIQDTSGEIIVLLDCESEFRTHPLHVARSKTAELIEVVD